MEETNAKSGIELKAKESEVLEDKILKDDLIKYIEEQTLKCQEYESKYRVSESFFTLSKMTYFLILVENLKRFNAIAFSN